MEALVPHYFEGIENTFAQRAQIPIWATTYPICWLALSDGKKETVPIPIIIPTNNPTNDPITILLVIFIPPICQALVSGG